MCRLRLCITAHSLLNPGFSGRLSAQAVTTGPRPCESLARCVNPAAPSGHTRSPSRALSCHSAEHPCDAETRSCSRAARFRSRCRAPGAGARPTCRHGVLGDLEIRSPGKASVGGGRKPTPQHRREKRAPETRTAEPHGQTQRDLASDPGTGTWPVWFTPQPRSGDRTRGVSVGGKGRSPCAGDRRSRSPAQTSRGSTKPADGGFKLQTAS